MNPQLIPYYPHVVAWLAAHPVARGMLTMLAIPLVGVFFNWATWKRTPEEWALYQVVHPNLSRLIKITRAVLPHLRKIPSLAPFLPTSLRPASTPEAAELPADVQKAIAEALALAKRAQLVKDVLIRGTDQESGKNPERTADEPIAPGPTTQPSAPSSSESIHPVAMSGTKEKDVRDAKETDKP